MILRIYEGHESKVQVRVLAKNVIESNWSWKENVETVLRSNGQRANKLMAQPLRFFYFFFQSLTPMIVFVRSFVCCIYDCLYKHLSVLDCKHFPRWTQRRFHPGTPSDVLRFTFQTYKIYPLTWNQSWIDKYELSSLKVFIYWK